MIIGITGKIGSGKDTAGQIIRWIQSPYLRELWKDDIEYFLAAEPQYGHHSNWEVKKWADSLKDITCMLLGCTREQIENREWKEAPLGEEWALLRETSSYGAPDVIYPVDYKGLTHIAHTHKEVLTPRKILQLLGTEGGRKIIHPNIWVNALMNQYKTKEPNEKWETTHNKPFLDSYVCHCDICNRAFPSANKRAYLCNGCWDKKDWFPKWIITDTRFPNEVEAIKDKGGIIINIQRPETDHLAGTHESETALDNYDYNPHVIVNDGDMFHLVIKIEKLLKQLNLVTL